MAVLTISLSTIKARVLFLTGPHDQHRRRYVNVSAFSAKKKTLVCRTLYGLDMLTGSNSTSAFEGRARQQAFTFVPVTRVDFSTRAGSEVAELRLLPICCRALDGFIMKKLFTPCMANPSLGMFAIQFFAQRRGILISFHQPVLPSRA